jgi:hypothetical protein
MNAFDDLLKRLTERFKIDSELRLELMQELRSHLETGSAEYRSAGLPPVEADAQAARALGEEAQLAQQLWDANRRRLRQRAAARWGGAALLPAAVAATLLLVVGLLATLRPVLSLLSGGNTVVYALREIAETAQPSDLLTPSLSSLTPEQRFIFEGDGAPTRLARDKAVADRWPENPVYYGNYVATLFTDLRIGDRELKAEPSIGELVRILDRGEQLAPDDGFYNLLKAHVLLCSSSTIDDDPNHVWTVTGHEGARTTKLVT